MGDEPVVEYAQLMAGGGMHVRNDHPDIERIFPLRDWIEASQRHGGKVYRRTVVVVEGWTAVSDMPEPGRGQADHAETDTEARADGP